MTDALFRETPHYNKYSKQSKGILLIFLFYFFTVSVFLQMHRVHAWYLPNLAFPLHMQSWRTLYSADFKMCIIYIRCDYASAMDFSASWHITTYQ